MAIRAGAERIVLNGSFTTDTMEPNDVDCVLLATMGFPKDRQALQELRSGLPFLQIAIVRQKDFDKLVQEFFATDRFESPKGMVEVML